MKNFRLTIILVLTGLVYSLGFSNNPCFSYAVIKENKCEVQNKNSKDLSFIDLYKYNHPNFTECDLNTNTSLLNIESDLAEKVAELQKHDNHLHYLVSSIKRKHQYLISSNTDASYSYSIYFDTQAAKPEEVINYGIKVPWIK